jgi:hypothetical protein
LGAAGGAEETLSFEKPSLEEVAEMGGNIDLIDVGAGDGDAEAAAAVVVSGSTVVSCSLGGGSGDSAFFTNTGGDAGGPGVALTTFTGAVAGWRARGLESSPPFPLASKCLRRNDVSSAFRLELWLFPVVPRFSRASRMALLLTPISLANWFIRMKRESSVVEELRKSHSLLSISHRTSH